MFDLLAAVGGAIGAAWLLAYNPSHQHSPTGVGIRLFVSVTVAVINTRPAVDLINRVGWLTIGPTDYEYIALVGSVLGFFAHGMVGILDVTRQRLRGKDVFEVFNQLRDKNLKDSEKEEKKP